MWPGHGWGFDWGMMMLGGLLMLLFWGGVIFLIIVAIRTLTRPGQPGAAGDRFSTDIHTPLEILQERYARGEITREQYLEMRRDLES